MQMQGNTILITGGGSGIGRGLAEAFHAAGNRVIIAGRRQSALDQTTAANPGMESALLDIEDAAAIRRFAEKMTSAYPALNVVIHNAGIMKMEPLKDAATDVAEAIVTTNLLGPIRLNSALLPHLLGQPQGAIMTVSSGLAFVPLAQAPTYCASKAAIHAYTQSLRYQLKDTAIRVLELVPPYVQTELLGPQQTTDPEAMPLKDFIDEVMRIIETPGTTEICVERVKPLRYAEAGGDYATVYTQFNEAMAKAGAAGGH